MGRINWGSIREETEMLEIRWHARGGQGVKTASQALAQAAFAEGFYIRAFPEYGPERSGAPVKAFNRIAGERIKVQCGIYKPDIVVVVDDSLLDSENVDVTEGLRADGVLLVNTRLSTEEVRAKTGFAGQILVLEADRIAKGEGCGFANVPLLGALARVLDLPLTTVQEEMKAVLGKKLSDKVIQANLACLAAGYEAVGEVRSGFSLAREKEREKEKERKGVHAGA